MRLAAALLVGLVVGVTVAALSNAAVYQPFDLGWPPNLTVPLIGAALLFRSFRRSSKNAAGGTTPLQDRWSSDLYR